jgi:hypothetical protein
MKEINSNVKNLSLFYSMWGINNQLSRSAEKVLVNDDTMSIALARSLAEIL